MYSPWPDTGSVVTRSPARLNTTQSTVDKHLRAIRDRFGDDANLTDLADSFGLRDMSRPQAGPPRETGNGSATSAARLERDR